MSGTLQDYTGYTETDTASRLTVAANTLTIVTLDDDEDMRLYKDFTASYFDEDFEHTLKVNVTLGTGAEACYVWALTNSVANPLGTLRTATTDMLAVEWKDGVLYLIEVETSEYTDYTTTLSLSTDYYLRIVRDEAVGTYGTLYCYIYTDREYCELVDTLTLTLHVKNDWQYLWGCGGVGNGGGSTSFSGTIVNLTRDIYAYTKEQIRTRVRDLLNEATASFWTNTELDYWINDGIREIAEISGCIQNIDSLSTTNGTRTISYTGYDCVNVEYVPSSGTRVALVQAEPLRDGRGIYNGTVPQFWWTSKGVIGIDPLPDATYTLNAYIADIPSDLTVDSQIPEIPPAFRPLLIYYVCWRAHLKENNYGAASLYHQIYQSELIYVTQDNIVNIPDARSEMRYE
jgi:hypothetical protein